MIFPEWLSPDIWFLSFLSLRSFPPKIICITISGCLISSINELFICLSIVLTYLIYDMQPKILSSCSTTLSLNGIFHFCSPEVHGRIVFLLTVILSQLYLWHYFFKLWWSLWYFIEILKLSLSIFLSISLIFIFSILYRLSLIPSIITLTSMSPSILLTIPTTSTYLIKPITLLPFALLSCCILTRSLMLFSIAILP